MNDAYRVSCIVIVNYHRADLTARAARSVLAEARDDAELIVIDNESDGSWAALEIAGDPRVTTLENRDNIGFGAACNQGIERAVARGCAGVLLLNNDAELEPGALNRLRDAAGATGLAAPKILLPDGRIYSTGGIVELWRGRCRNRGIYQADRGQYDRPEALRFASACVLYLSSEVLRAGLRFHEPYLLYYEDADFCLSAARAGFAVSYEPRAVARHLESASTPADAAHRLAYYEARNRRLFVERNSRGLARPWRGLCTRFIMCLKGMRFMAEGKKKSARAIYRGLMDFRAGRFGKMPEK